MKLSLTRQEAIMIAYLWAAKQDTAIDMHGGYLGELYVVRDRLVFFINCNGEKYDGPTVTIMSKDDALSEAKARLFEWEDDYVNEKGDLDFEAIEEFDCFGQDVKSLADYLMSTDGSETADYSAGDPYKENSTAHNAFYGK